jgi:hypothetical protein
MKNRWITYCKVFVVLLVVSFWVPAISQAADVSFSWGASTGQVDGYRVYWGENATGPYQNNLYEVNGTTLSCDTVLDDYQEYYLVCRAFNQYGESDDSNVVHWFHVLPGNPQILRWSFTVTVGSGE